MANYDPSFSKIVKPGDILVSGFNFGCGSSREQAATCVVASDIPLVVAGSFGNIFARNSINNALMGIEVPRLVARLREKFSTTTTTTRRIADGRAAGLKEPGITEPTRNQDSLDSPPPAPPRVPEREKILTRRTGWMLTWDVGRSTVVVKEGKGGPMWEQKVGELPPNVQEIIAKGGLQQWVKSSVGL